MSKPWPMVALGEVLSLRLDVVAVDPAESYRIAGVYSFGRGLLSRQPLLGANTTYKVLHRLHEGDFVLSQLKAWEGALAKITCDHDGWYLSPQFPTFRAVRDRLSVDYLAWYCKQEHVWESLRGSARGMGARRDLVSPKTFLALRIPLPPLAEQRRIVARIEELAGKIEEARRLRTASLDAANVLYPVSLGRFFRALAESHEVIPLGELSSCITDGPHKTPQYVDEGIPFVTVKNMVSGRLDFRELRHITREDHNEFSRRCKPEQGDVLYSKDGATRGCPCFVDTDREFNIFVSVALIKPLRDRLDGQYLVHLLNSQWVKDRMTEQSRGDMIPHIVLGEIRKFPVPIPCISQQRRIAEHLNRVSDKVESLRDFQRATQVELDALVPSILDAAFKGEA